MDPHPTPPHPLHRATLLKLEEEWVERTCSQIAAFKPDVVITEKGLSDLAAHYLMKVGGGAALWLPPAAAPAARLAGWLAAPHGTPRRHLPA